MKRLGRLTVPITRRAVQWDGSSQLLIVCWMRYSGAYRKFGPKRYELRLTVRNFLMEGLSQINPQRQLSSKDIRLTLGGLRTWIDLLPASDTAKVLAAFEALRSLEGGSPSFYEDQAKQDAWKAACVAARIPMGEAIDYLNRKLRV